jgi:hypothetical protein
MRGRLTHAVRCRAPWEWRRWLLFKLRRRRIKYSLQTVCRLRQKVVTTDKGQPVITCSPCGKAGPDIRWSLLPMAGEMGLWCRLGPIRKVSPSCREYRFPRVGSLKSPAVTSGTKLAAVVGTAVVPAFAGILSRVGCRGEDRQPAIRPSKRQQSRRAQPVSRWQQVGHVAMPTAMNDPIRDKYALTARMRDGRRSGSQWQAARS